MKIKVDSEPSEHGDHMVMLSIKKEKHRRKGRDHSSTRFHKQDFNSSDHLRCKDSVRSPVAKKSTENCHIMHQLQKNFEVFALNNQINGEDDCFSIKDVMMAMPDPNDP